MQNRRKSRLGVVRGALGGSLGNHFGSQGRLGQQKEAGCPKMVLTWVPFLGSIFDIFLHLWLEDGTRDAF